MMLFLNDKVPTARLALSNARAFCCTRPRVQRATGVPCAFVFFRGQKFMHHPGRSRRGNAKA
jgi:hypothetical protein